MKDIKETGKFRRLDKTVEKTEERVMKLQGEVILQTVGIPINATSMTEARRFFNQMENLGFIFDDLADYLDELIALAHDKMPKNHLGKGSPEQLAKSLVKSLGFGIQRVKQMFGQVFKTRTGEAIAATDDLTKKMQATCQGRAEEITSAKIAFYDKMDEAMGQPEESDEDADDPAVKKFICDDLMESIFRTMSRIRAFEFGVPQDLYNDVVMIGKDVSATSLFFFLRLLYKKILSGEIEPMFQRPSELGLVGLKGPMQFDPEKFLPDEDWMKHHQQLTRDVNGLQGGTAATECLERLRTNGVEYETGVQLLARLGTGQDIFRSANELYSVCEGNDLREFASHCGENPSFIPAFEVLKRVMAPQRAAVFLRESGDYSLGNKILAEVVCRLSHKDEAVRLLADNVLYFCAGESADKMAVLLENMEKASQALRAFIGFAKTEQHFHQLALVRYLQSRGVSNDFEDFVSVLTSRREESVFEALAQTSLDGFLGVLKEAEAPLPELPEPTSPIKSLASQALVQKYGLGLELATMPVPLLKAADDVLLALQGTSYEEILLGQRRLRQLLFKRIRLAAKETERQISELAKSRVDYRRLKEILQPEFSIPAESSSAEQKAWALEAEKILVISERITEETLAHLQEVFKVPATLIRPNDAGWRFKSIRPGVMVVFDTGQTSHKVYWHIKHLVKHSGAKFRQTSRTNKEAVAEVIRT